MHKPSFVARAILSALLLASCSGSEHPLAPRDPAPASAAESIPVSLVVSPVDAAGEVIVAVRTDSGAERLGALQFELQVGDGLTYIGADRAASAADFVLVHAPAPSTLRVATIGMKGLANDGAVLVFRAADPAAIDALRLTPGSVIVGPLSRRAAVARVPAVAPVRVEPLVHGALLKGTAAEWKALAAAQPALARTLTAIAVAGPVYGDADLSGSIDVNDALVIAEFAVAQVPAPTTGTLLEVSNVAPANTEDGVIFALPDPCRPGRECTLSAPYAETAPGTINILDALSVLLEIVGPGDPIVGAAVPTASAPALTRVAAGNAHTCVITPTGDAYCAGDNAFGQLGDGTVSSSATAVRVAASAGVAFAQISTGSNHSCAVTTSGAVYCWGSNNVGQLGDGSTTSRRSPALVSLPTGVTATQVAAGQLHSCVRTSTGAAYCWGFNLFGQVGDGTVTQRVSPVLVALPAGETLTQVTAGSFNSCGLASSGSAYCWGSGEFGQLGNGATDASLRPVLVAVSAGVSFTQIGTGAVSSCGLSSTGVVYCWGANNVGQLGDGTTTDRPTPAPIIAPSGARVTWLATSSNHYCVLTASGAAWCWGNNSSGQLGDVSAINRLSPVPVDLPTGVTLTQVAAGTSHSCGVSATALVYCWGANGGGQLGDGTTTFRTSPVVVSGVSFTQVEVYFERSCGVTSAGPAYCWGVNTFGQLGDGSRNQRTSPTLVALPTGVAATQVALGGAHTCARVATGAAYCWGLNEQGQLGDGTTLQRLSPVTVAAPAGASFVRVATGISSSCGLTVAGTAYCWGDNAFGQLGDGTTTPSSTPSLVAAPPGVSFIQITQGGSRSCALTASGAVYCWGLNVGLTPVLITAPAGVLFSQVATSGRHSCGVTTAGAAFCWGSNIAGQLGDGTTTSRLTPVPVAAPAGVSFVRVATGPSSSCGVTTAGTTYCWGFNREGQLGDGSRIQRELPALVAAPVGVSFTQVAPGETHSCGTTAAGTSYCWGDNSKGQLGFSPYTITRFLLP